MPKKENTLIGNVLEVLFELTQLLPRPFETKYAWNRRLRHLDPGRYHNTLWKLEKKGDIKITKKADQKFIELTKKGQLEALLIKAKLDVPKKWDGKWRLIIFDIPENSRDKRNLLRSLLKRNNFYKLQASVFINPYPLNREAINYLQEMGLIDYIRILRIDEMDNDKLLRKKYSL